MRRLSGLLLLGLGVTAGAAGGYWYAKDPPGIASLSRSVADTAAAAADRADSLLPRPERRSLLVGNAEERQGWPRLSPRLRGRGADIRSGGEIKTSAPKATRLAEDSLLPQSDGPRGHLAGAEEGLDGDGLHPRLRGRGAGRRKHRPRQPRQNPAQWRSYRNRRACEPSCGRCVLSARVEHDEGRITVVAMRSEGFVEDLFVSRTGQHVHAGEPLFRVYSNDIVRAQSELSVLRSPSRYRPGCQPAISKAPCCACATWASPRAASARCATRA